MIALSSMSTDNLTLASSSSERTMLTSLDLVESVQALGDIEDDTITRQAPGGRKDLHTPIKVDWIAT